MSIIKISDQPKRHNGSFVTVSPKGIDYLAGILWTQGFDKIGESSVFKHDFTERDCDVHILFGRQTSHESAPFDTHRPLLGYEVYGEPKEARKVYAKLALTVDNFCGRSNMLHHEPEETLMEASQSEYKPKKN